MRKTIKIIDLIKEINMRNKKSVCPSDVRSGWNSILEDILVENNCYAGFNYLSSSDLIGYAKKYDPGIIMGEDKKPIFPDPTRINFYIHKKLMNI